MTERRKLELQLNQPIEIELLYDEPVVGKSQYGDYFLYAVKAKDSEFAFFAPEEVHQGLLPLRRGDKATVTKSAEQKGNKLVTKYIIDVPEVITKSTKAPANETQSSVSNSSSDKYYDAMLHSYKDALQIQSELNGMVDVSRIAITLFIARSGKK
ncbi:MAG: hypothetical protein ABI638_04370 [Ignavibacteriota bacterium]